jgi:hypothetical protein
MTASASLDDDPDVGSVRGRLSLVDFNDRDEDTMRVDLAGDEDDDDGDHRRRAADVEGTEDPVRMYLREIGKVYLLKAADEKPVHAAAALPSSFAAGRYRVLRLLG